MAVSFDIVLSNSDCISLLAITVYTCVIVGYVIGWIVETDHPRAVNIIYACAASGLYGAIWATSACILNTIWTTNIALDIFCSGTVLFVLLVFAISLLCDIRELKTTDLSNDKTNNE